MVHVYLHCQRSCIFPLSWLVALLASNLFLQVPLAVAQVLLTRDSEFATTEPYPVENVHQDFTMPGIKVNQILPVKIVDSADATPSEVNLVVKVVGA